MLLQHIPGICVQVKISRQIAHQTEEDEEEGLSRPFAFAFPFPITTTTLAKTLFATIFWRSGYLAGSTRVVPYPGGAVNTLYNEIIFSNMIHIDLAIRHPPVTEKRTAGAIARREMAGAILACWTAVFTAYVYLTTLV
jgi:hypothetical protein